MLAILGAGVVALGVAIAAPVAAHASTVNPAVAENYILEHMTASGTLTGYCVDNPDFSDADNTPLLLEYCADLSDSGEGYFIAQTSEYSENYAQIINVYSGLCLSDRGGGAGSPIELEGCDNSPNQAMCIDNYNNGSWPIMWVFANGEPLNDYNNVDTTGNPIVAGPYLEGYYDNANAFGGPNYPNYGTHASQWDCTAQ